MILPCSILKLVKPAASQLPLQEQAQVMIFQYPQPGRSSAGKLGESWVFRCFGESAPLLLWY